MSEGHHHDAGVSQHVRAVETLLEEKGVVDGDELDRILDGLGSLLDGARVVARAWVDGGFRARLLADGNAGIAELGYSMSGGPQPQVLRVVENTPLVHNVVVCTLCSCYPVALLGPSPSWYKSEAYRSRIVRQPREVLEEFGLQLPDDTDIRVWDASAETRYLVLPVRPAGTDDRSEGELAGLVSRRGMIGTAAV